MKTNTSTIKLLNLSRKAFKKVFIPKDLETYNGEVNYNFVTVKEQDASNLIKDGLEGESPFMAGRLGSVEMKCLANYYSIKNHSGNFLSYVRGKISPFWWDDDVIFQMGNNAGFFPSVPEQLEKFAELVIEDLNHIDVLGSWLDNEKLFKNELDKSIRVPIGDLQPYNHRNPWTEALTGKKVLVIHPFEDSIKSQYKVREYLFNDPRMLPSFTLSTIKAVQSIAGNSTSFNSWFDALNYMKDQMSSMDFDIAIIGCGAYGLPLAAHAKRMGKKAVHLGGATQVLFGIIGKRWEEQKYNKYISDEFANTYWVRPLNSEVPTGAEKIEGGCYW